MTEIIDTFAICLGNDSIALSVYKEGQATLVVNADGFRTTPAVVAFSEEGEAVVGDTAQRISVKRVKEAVHSLPFILANRKNPMAVRKQKFGFELVLSEDGETITGLQTTPGNDPETPPQEHTFVQVFKALFAHAKVEVGAFLGNDVVSRAVLVIPAVLYNDEEAVKILVEAAKEAEVDVCRITRPDAAAVLEGPKEGNNLVFDMGGMGTTVSAVKVTNGLVQVEATAEVKLGGRDFTDVVANFFAAEFQRKTRMDIVDDKKAKRKLFFNSEPCKKNLSVSDHGLVAIEALSNGVDFTGKITTPRYEMACMRIVNPLKEGLDKALADASFDKADRIVMIGGGSLAPPVQRFVESLEMGEVVRAKKCNETAAMGAAEASGACYLSNTTTPNAEMFAEAGNHAKSTNAINSQCELTVLSQPVGLKGGNGAIKVLAAAGTPLPHTATITLRAPKGQDAVLVEVVEGEATVCTVPLTGVTGKKINVEVSVSADAKITVKADDGAEAKAEFTA